MQAASAWRTLGGSSRADMPPSLRRHAWSSCRPGSRHGGTFPVRDPADASLLFGCRGGEFFGDLQHAIDMVRPFGTTPGFVLEADDEAGCADSRRPGVLILSKVTVVVDGIITERALLTSLRESADLLIDTSPRYVHQLRTRIRRPRTDGTRPLQITVMSLTSSTVFRSTLTSLVTAASFRILTGCPTFGH